MKFTHATIALVSLMSLTGCLEEISAHEVYNQCISFDPIDASDCELNIESVADVNQLLEPVTDMLKDTPDYFTIRICIPEHTEIDELKKVFLTYIDNNPELRPFNSVDITTASFMKAYPCTA